MLKHQPSPKLTLQNTSAQEDVASNQDRIPALEAAMASANKAPLSLCLALAVLGATAAHVATAAPAPHRRLQKLLPCFGDGDGDPKEAPVVPPPTAVACWKSILASESCVDNILRSLAGLQVRVSRVCCSVLEKIGDRCVVDAFSGFPFNPKYPPLVKRVCGLAV